MTIILANYEKKMKVTMNISNKRYTEIVNVKSFCKDQHYLRMKHFT
jgi:hypothetical protein